jgi:undecaprenyl-diphosphatase
MKKILDILESIDTKILFAIQKLRNPKLDLVMKSVSKLGNAGFIWIVTAAALGIFQSFLSGVHLILVLAVCVLLNNILIKSLFNRVRPCDLYSGEEKLIERPMGSSFPSGHTSSSFACAVALCYICPQISSAAFVFAVVMGFSRTYLFVHYPLDVLFGSLTGTLIGEGIMTIITKL